MVRGGTWWLIPISGVPRHRNVGANDLAVSDQQTLQYRVGLNPHGPARVLSHRLWERRGACRTAPARPSPGRSRSGLLSSSLEDGGCAGLCHSSIGVRLPRERRPSGFHHEFRLFPGWRDGPERGELLDARNIGLLPCKTDREQGRCDRGISLLHRHLAGSAARHPASPTEPQDHRENATDYNTPDPWFEPRALHLHEPPPGASQNV